MRTFAPKPTAAHQATPAKSTTLGQANFGRSREANSILHLQSTIGNQAVQRLLQANAEEFAAGSATTPSTHFGHSFSRMARNLGLDENTIRVNSDTSAVDLLKKNQAVAAAIDPSTI